MLHVACVNVAVVAIVFELGWAGGVTLCCFRFCYPCYYFYYYTLNVPKLLHPPLQFNVRIPLWILTFSCNEVASPFFC